MSAEYGVFVTKIRNVKKKEKEKEKEKKRKEKEKEKERKEKADIFNLERKALRPSKSYYQSLPDRSGCKCNKN